MVLLLAMAECAAAPRQLGWILGEAEPILCPLPACLTGIQSARQG